LAWTQEGQRILASDFQSDAEFGAGHQGVAIRGDVVLVGALQHDRGAQCQGTNDNAGAAYLFRWNLSEAIWQEICKFTQPFGIETDNQFGTAVTLQEERCLVGVPGDDVGVGTSSGSVFAFELGPECAKDVLAGNVNTGAGRPVANVLTVNGGGGDPACRRVIVASGVPAMIAIARPPAADPTGKGHHAVWIYDDVPTNTTVTPLRYRPNSGVIHELGMGCRCLPVNNSVVPQSDSCDCPITFARGFTSRALSAGSAARFCLNVQPRIPRYPTAFPVTFPVGTFTIGGLIVDSNSASTTPISIMNWVIVDSR
jgi:hypothetical protein